MHNYTRATYLEMDPLHELMLDALRRGILLSRGIDAGASASSARASRTQLVDKKRRIATDINSLSRDQKITVLLAVARLAGIEAIGLISNGCIVDITEWEEAKVDELMKVIEFVSI